MTLKRILGLIVGVLAAITGMYLIFTSIAVLFAWGAPDAPNMGTLIAALIPLALASLVLFESYRFLRFFSSQSKTQLTSGNRSRSGRSIVG